MDYESLADTIDTSNVLYTEYKDCKGFKDSSFTSSELLLWLIML